MQRDWITGCRLQESTGGGEGVWLEGLSSHSAFIKKFPVHDPSGSSQGVSLMNPGTEFRLLFPREQRARPVLFSGLTGLEIPRA